MKIPMQVVILKAKASHEKKPSYTDTESPACAYILKNCLQQRAVTIAGSKTSLSCYRRRTP